MKVFQATAAIRSYPPDTGGYQRTHGLVSAFPKHGDSVYRYCCTGPLSTYYTDGELIEREIRFSSEFVEVRHYSLLHDVRKLTTLVGLPGFLWPVVFKSWVGKTILRRAADHDVLLADDPYLTLFLANNTNVPTVYSSHNVEYQRYLSMFDGFLTGFFGKHLRRVESEAAERADAVVCVTESDSEEFSKYAESTIVVPNGIARSKVLHDAEPAERARYGIPEDATVSAFLGSDYGPNVEAAEWAVRNWSELDERHHLLVIGSSGNSIDSDLDTVHITGYVEDLQAVLSMADIALNPIFSGGGSNIKLVEYFAARLPVVSTSFGARGFDVGHDEHLVLAERDEFLPALRRLADDGELRERLGTNGHQLVADRYTWEYLSEQFRNELRALVR